MNKNLDYVSIIVPLIIVGILSAFYMTGNSEYVENVRSFLGNDFGLYYILLGIGSFSLTMFFAFKRKYGDVVLGGEPKPLYKDIIWGAMIFTSTMAADLIFFSLSEWIYYMQESRVQEYKEALTYSLFHWGPIAWSFYILLAVVFGYMIHVGGSKRQKFSEACRPLLGVYVDGVVGKVIDILAIVTLIAGTATTFSVATPLITRIFVQVFGFKESIGATIGVLILIAVIYTFVVLLGMKGISKLATVCIYLYIGFLGYVLIFGGHTRVILELGLESFGGFVSSFISSATTTTAFREDTFTQDWTVFYWAYWMAWSVATPFFIGSISKGRSVKNTILGAYFYGIAGTFASFIILSGQGMGVDASLNGEVLRSGVEDIYSGVMLVLQSLPLGNIIIFVLAINLILFFVTTFDVITLVVSKYSYKELDEDKEPGKGIRIYWSLLFIVLPIAIIFSEGMMYSLQSISIIAAFPIGVVMILMVISFIKTVKKH